jgi:leucyl-tRNA synthetase
LRETDTMDTFVDSSWYFLRYCDPHNDQGPFERDVVDMWMPVDQYIGGVEHAILHLMYARFFTKALADMGYLGFEEPFANLFTQGMITRDGAKMSKSRGNVVSPSEIVGRYGADTARCYINYLGPPDQDADWSDDGVGGIYRFLSRLWRIAAEAPAGAAEPSGEATAVLRKAHWAIDKVTSDMGRWGFNTALAAVIELVNDLYRYRDELVESEDGISQMRFAVATAGSLLFPFAPHLGAEVYERMTGRRVWEEPWPVADEELLRAETVQIAVQVNGKLRGVITAAAGSGRDELERLARESERVRQYVENGNVIKTIVVPDKLVNFVVRG